MFYHLCLTMEVKTFSLFSKGNLKKLTVKRTFFILNLLNSRCALSLLRDYFAWIFSLILKPKGLALFKKASEKCIEFWEQISTTPASSSHYGKHDTG